MKKKIAVLSAVVLCVALSMGCISEEATTVSIGDDILSNQTQKELIVETTIEENFWAGDRTKIVIIGKLIEVTFNSENPDVLVFQDGEKKVVFCARKAENFFWAVGETCKVTIREEGANKVVAIIGVEIVNIQTTQSAG